MGRKKVSDPRIFGYRLRLNEEENRMLNDICKETGITKSKLFRKFLNEQYELISIRSEILKTAKENHHGLQKH